MLRLSLAPCAPCNVTQDLMIAAAKIARQHKGVMLHTHLAENVEDIDYMRKTFDCRPGEYIKYGLLLLKAMLLSFEVDNMYSWQMHFVHFVL